MRPHEVWYDTKVSSTKNSKVNSGLGSLEYSILPAHGRSRFVSTDNVTLTRKEKDFKRLLKTAKELGTLQMLRYRDTLAGSSTGITNFEQELGKQYHRCAHYAAHLVNVSVNDPDRSSEIFQPLCQRELLDDNNVECPESSMDPGNRTALTGDVTKDLFNSAWDFVRERMAHGQHTTPEELTEMRGLATTQASSSC